VNLTLYETAVLLLGQIEPNFSALGQDLEKQQKVFDFIDDRDLWLYKPLRLLSIGTGTICTNLTVASIMSSATFDNLG
jgi:hypothetical protein